MCPPHPLRRWLSSLHFLHLFSLISFTSCQCNRPDVQVTVTGVEKPEVSLSYTVQEPLRGGNLIVEAAEALGVAKGPAYSALKNGEAVKNAAGAVVLPEQVQPRCPPAGALQLDSWVTFGLALDAYACSA